MNVSRSNYITLTAWEDIACKLWKVMNKKNISQSQLSRMTGIGRDTINRMCQGQPVHMNNLIVVLDTLGLDEITIKWRE